MRHRPPDHPSHQGPSANPRPDEKPHVFDRPENVRRVLRALYTVCGALFLLDFGFHRHVIHPFEGLWGFYAIYGWVACVTLVLIAKQLRKAVMRPEDYYDAD